MAHSFFKFKTALVASLLTLFFARPTSPYSEALGWITEFKKNPQGIRKKANLEHILQDAIYSAEPALALDAISYFKLKNLRKPIEDYASTDSTGTSYLILAALSEPAEWERLSKNFLHQLLDLNRSPATKMILFDLLNRMGSPISPTRLDQFAHQESSPEVRGVILDYLRTQLVSRHDIHYLNSLMQIARATQNSYQIRVQISYLLQELSPHFQNELTRLFGYRLPSNGALLHQPFRSAQRLKVAVIFGYKDTRPARFVGDRYERALLIERVLKMGFIRSKSDSELFSKQKEVSLKILASSVGPDDQANRTNPFQSWQSAHVRHEFELALQNSNFVYYDGHSREGGGPDFAPPQLKKNFHVDYARYTAAKAGLRLILTSLSKKHRVQTLALFSCSSDRHFSAAIHHVSPHLNLMTTRSLTYYSDSLRDLTRSLETQTR